MLEVEFLEGEGDLVLLRLLEESVEGCDEHALDEAFDGGGAWGQWGSVWFRVVSGGAGASEERAQGGGGAVLRCLVWKGECEDGVIFFVDFCVVH